MWISMDIPIFIYIYIYIYIYINMCIPICAYLYACRTHSRISIPVNNKDTWLSRNVN